MKRVHLVSLKEDRSLARGKCVFSNLEVPCVLYSEKERKRKEKFNKREVTNANATYSQNRKNHQRNMTTNGR